MNEKPVPGGEINVTPPTVGGETSVNPPVSEPANTIGAEPNAFWHPIQHAAWQDATAAYGDFKDLTSGLDPRGIQRVLEEDIKIGIIEEAKKVILESQNFADFKTACENGWKGNARLEFFKKIEGDQALVCQDMDDEYWSIYNRFNEMIKSYREEDMHLGENI